MTIHPESTSSQANLISLPSDAGRLESWQTEYVSVSAYRRGAREVLVAEPTGMVRLDESTGQPAKPLFVALGINGDQKMLWTVSALAEEDQRQVIGIRYPEKLEGRARLTERPELSDITSPVPKLSELDATQAKDILRTLDELQVERVDVLAESRGAISTVVAARQALERFGHILLLHPTGQGNESYLRAHSGAAKIAIQNLGRKALLLDRVDPLARQLAVGGDVPGGRLARDPLGWRREQVSVARAKKARLNRTAAIIKDKMDSGQSITIAYDKRDPAIRKRRLERNNVGNIPMVETHLGRHGVGYSRKAAHGIAQYMQHVERTHS